jgi:hypothetical protein
MLNYISYIKKTSMSIKNQMYSSNLCPWLFHVPIIKNLHAHFESLKRHSNKCNDNSERDFQKMISSNVLLQGTDVGCMYDVRSQLF